MTDVDVTVVPRTRDALAALGARRGPIIVGPWLSEVGFELLYWIPFLRWACAFANLHPDDLWIVSRGGCRSWYADVGAHYVDVLDSHTPDEFRTANTRRMAEQASHHRVLNLRHGRMSTKQHMVTTFDRDILTHVTRTEGLTAPRLLHPSMMYQVFRPFWRRLMPDLYRDITIPKRLSASTRLEGLPASYVAAKFYASAACASTPSNARMVHETVRTLAASTDVVLLHSGTRYDDHGEFPIASHPRIHRVALTPSRNLETQTAVIAGASRFVGTYGGFAYLAPFVGVNTQTFYARPNFRKDHRQVMDTLSRTTLGTSFTVDLISGGIGKVHPRGGKRHAA